MGPHTHTHTQREREREREGIEGELLLFHAPRALAVP
jgi:hypothetical protein